MAERRSYVLALALLVGGGVLLLIGFALPWASADLPLAAGVAGVTTGHEFTGQSLFPGAATTGWVCLAGVAGILATRSWGRALVGAIVLLAGVVAVAAAGSFAVSPSGSVEASATSIVGSPTAVESSLTAWWMLALIGGALAAASGAWTVVRGRRWPAMGSRYERGSRRVAAISPWEAMDRGDDPTDDGDPTDDDDPTDDGAERSSA